MPAQASAPKKDPNRAALISVAGMLLMIGPGIGYFFIGETRKGIIYLVIPWVLFAITIASMFLGLLSIFAFACSGLLILLLLLLDLAIVWDVYRMAKGEPARLPTF